MPKVSICIPTYNQINFLKRNLDSIVVQTFSDYEIVITDDSTDNRVRDFVMDYSSHFGNKLKYFKNDKRLGSPENWNEAVRLSDGEFIKVLHHDDAFSENYSLEKFVCLLEDYPQIDFAFSSTFINSKNEVHQISDRDISLLKENPLLLVANNLIGAPSTTIFRKNSSLPFDRNLKWLVDVEFYLRLLENSNFLFNYSPESLIITCSGHSHQVTNECLNNKDVELYEYFYLFELVFAKRKIYNAAAMKEYLLLLIRICNIYKIKCVKEIRSSGFTGHIHRIIKTYISVSCFSVVMGKLFLKLYRWI